MKSVNFTKKDIEILNLIKKEENRQLNELEMIASENYASISVRNALGSVLTNKYSEGYPGKRYYAGNEVIDDVESLAINRAKKLFSADHVNVQPLSGSPANIAVFLALLSPKDKVMGLSLDQGGHLSHGHPLNFSGKMYEFISYGVNKRTEIIDYDEVEKLAIKHKPKMIIAGFSAYPRNLNWKRFAQIAKKINAITMADIAHIAGLIAGKQLENPVPLFDVITTTTHKTLRGPRGAIIMCKNKYAKEIDRAVFPGIQGGPHDNVTAAKAICFYEALNPNFQKYSEQILKNAKTLEFIFKENNLRLVSGGTDNHLLLLDMTSIGLTGKIAESALSKAGISVNKNMIPFDKRKPFDPSGIRIGTPAVTTRGMKEKEMKIVGKYICEALKDHKDDKKLLKIKNNIKSICKKFPPPIV